MDKEWGVNFFPPFFFCFFSVCLYFLCVVRVERKIECGGKEDRKETTYDSVCIL